MTNEPIAWMVYTLDGKSVCVTDNPTDFTPEHRALPLYTSPPAQRTWVEVEQVKWEGNKLIAKLKEKNT